MNPFFGSRQKIIDFFPAQVYDELAEIVIDDRTLPYEDVVRLDVFISSWFERVLSRKGKDRDFEGARELCALIEVAIAFLVYLPITYSLQRMFLNKWCEFRDFFLGPEFFTKMYRSWKPLENTPTKDSASGGHLLPQGEIPCQELLRLVQEKVESFTVHDLARALYFMEMQGDITIKKWNSDYLVAPVYYE